MLGHFGKILTMLDFFIILGQFGSVVTCLDLFRPLKYIFDQFGPFWTSLDPFWTILSHPDPSAPNWTHLNTIEPILMHFIQVSKRCHHATIRSHKIFQRLRKIWVFENKNAQCINVIPFWGNFCDFLGCFALYCLPQTFKKKFRRKFFFTAPSY